MRAIAAALCLALLVAVPPAPATAHPHAFIDFRTEPVLDDQGRIAGLKQHWRFDIFYSTFILETLGADPNDQVVLTQLARNTMLYNLEPYGYYTVATDGLLPLVYNGVTDVAAGTEDLRLWMEFTIRFADPLPAQGSQLRYRIYDPEYYIEMRHAEVEGGSPIVLSPPLSHCRTKIEDAEPGIEETLFAASLGVDVSAGFDLGVVFAQRATIDCP